MRRRGQTTTDKIYRAATKYKNSRKLRGLPREIQAKFKEKLEGIRLPEKSQKRGVFFETLSQISENICGNINFETLTVPNRNSSRFESAISEVQITSLLKAFSSLQKAVEIASRSSKPGEYFRFMARSEFEVFYFISSMDAFAKGRKITFEGVPEDKRKLGMDINNLVHDGSEEALRKFVSLLRGRLSEQLEEELRQGMEEAKFIEKMDFSEKEIKFLEKICIASILAELWQSSDALEILEEEYCSDAGKGVGEHVVRFAQQISDDGNKLVPDMLLDYGVYLYDEEKSLWLLPFSKTFTIGLFNGYVVHNQTFFSRRNTVGIGGGALGGGGIERSILLDGDVDFDLNILAQHELQHVFDNAIRFISDEVGLEYRARLAGAVFSDNTQLALGLLRNEIEWARKFLENETYEGTTPDQDLRNTAMAALLIEEKLLKNSKPESIQENAMKLLNNEYEREVGLSYDEIVEPFKKE